jgi:DNA/RNA endonuclease YhcR with UshA esterase domain
LTPNQLNTDFEKYESMLVRINDATLPSGTYNGTKTIATTAGDFKLYTMTSATFSGNTMPTGSLSLIGYTDQSTNDNRLVLRNPATDVIGGSGGGGGSTTDKTIMEIRDLFSGAALTLGKFKIKGGVISDKDSLNTDTRNLVIQDATGGVVVRFASNHAFKLNDEVEIDIEGASLELFSGLLQVNNVQNSKAVKTGNKVTTPRTATISEIITNFSQWESTLLKINNVTFPSGNYSGSKKLQSGTDTIISFTRSAATFANRPMPTGSRNVTGVLSIFGGVRQINIRSTSDVQ